MRETSTEKWNLVKIMRSILTVIPIRSGSRGVKNKNIRLLGGKPLVAHVIEAALQAGVDKLIVSTDDENYANIAKKFGAETPFIRPADISGGRVRLHHVMAHALHYFDTKGQHFDAVLSLQATVPLVNPTTIKRVIDKFQLEKCLSVGTVSQIRHGHPYLAKQIVGDNSDIAKDYLTLDKGVPRYPRQVRPDLYYFNGSIFLRDRLLLDNIDEDTNGMGAEPRVIVMDDLESINIDDEIDFDIAEYFLEKKKSK